MKFLKSIVLLFVAAALFTACKKDKEDLPAPPTVFKVEGVYVGKLGTGTAIPDGYFEIVLKPDHVLERIGLLGGVDGTGTWELNGNNFTASYKNDAGTVTVSLTGTLNKEQKRLSGDWNSTNGKSGKYHATQD